MMNSTASRMQARMPAFRGWLSANGASVLEPTNQWEVARFRSGDETCVIYRNKVGGIRYNGVSAELAWKSFASGKSWRAATPTSRRKKMTPLIAAIRKRDGDLCFFCQQIVGQDNESAEHLVSVTHGGPNHLSNLFLAHKTCNATAGHLSATEKIRIHVEAVLHQKSLQKEAA